MQQHGSQQPAAACGYPRGLFLTPPPVDFTCSICLEVLRDPVVVCSDHHTYCHACIAQWNETTCPECRAPIRQEEPARMARNMILQLEVRCPQGACDADASGGSGQTDSASSRSDVPADAEDGHQQKKRKQDHGAASSTASCEWTGKLKDCKAHVAVCPFVEVSCLFPEAGCAFRAARRDMGAHSGDMGAHLFMMMKTVAAVKAESASVQLKIAAVEAESAAGRVEGAAMKAEYGAMKSRIASLEIACASAKADSSSLQLYVSILQASGEEAAAGRMEWVSLIISCDLRGGNFMRGGNFTYTGQMRGGKRHGFGRTVWTEGTVKSYDGQWKEGLRHGQGIMKRSDGCYFEGLFREDKRHGQGFYKDSTGVSIEGEWEEGKKQGRFILTRANGMRYERVYEDDEMTSETPIE